MSASRIGSTPPLIFLASTPRAISLPKMTSTRRSGAKPTNTIPTKVVIQRCSVVSLGKNSSNNSSETSPLPSPLHLPISLRDE
jgi:hypothetical protein